MGPIPGRLARSRPGPATTGRAARGDALAADARQVGVVVVDEEPAVAIARDRLAVARLVERRGRLVGQVLVDTDVAAAADIRARRIAGTVRNGAAYRPLLVLAGCEHEEHPKHQRTHDPTVRSSLRCNDCIDVTSAYIRYMRMTLVWILAIAACSKHEDVL